jgi:hypothetical protein
VKSPLIPVTEAPGGSGGIVRQLVHEQDDNVSDGWALKLPGQRHPM